MHAVKKMKIYNNILGDIPPVFNIEAFLFCPKQLRGNVSTGLSSGGPIVKSAINFSNFRRKVFSNSNLTTVCNALHGPEENCGYINILASTRVGPAVVSNTGTVLEQSCVNSLQVSCKR